MVRRFLSILLLSVVSGFLLFFFSGCEKQAKTVTVDWANEHFNAMNDTEKIGQTFCLTVDPIKYFLYPSYKTRINTLVAKYKPGALFFTANIDTVKMEIRLEFNGNKLNDSIINLQHIAKTPMFIAADFESGAWTWDNNATRFPFPLALASAKSAEYAYRQGKITAVEAHAQGFNCLFSPMVNIASRGWNSMLELNSFGSDPALAGDLGVQFLTGCQEATVAGCIKYFPSTETNALTTMSVDAIDPDQLTVFQNCIAAGAKIVMCAPISFDKPAQEMSAQSFDPMIKDTLIGRLGFNGIIIMPLNTRFDVDSDEMELALVSNAMKAGNTMFLLPETTDVDIPLIDTLIQSALANELDISPFSIAAKKILDMKWSLGINDDDEKKTLRSMAGIGLPEYRKNSRDISERCITLLKNENHVIPADTKNQYIVSLSFLGDYSSQFSTIIDKELDKYTGTIRHINIFGIPDGRIEQEVIRRVGEADIVVCSFIIKPDIITDRMPLEPEIIELMKQITAINNKVIVVSFYDPHIIDQLHDIQGYCISYSPSESSITATFEVLFGIRDAEGTLPINISDTFKVGFGMRHTSAE